MEPQEEVDENPVSPVDLSIFKESLEQNLITILDLLPNQEKSLIIEESCITKFGFFIKTDFLTQRQFTKKYFYSRILRLIPNPQFYYILFLQKKNV